MKTASGTKSKPEVSASVMCASFTRLEEEIRALDASGIDSYHFDVMDGHFVPNLTFGLDIVRQVRNVTDRPFHVHLMVERPEEYVNQAFEAGVDVLFFHIEATRFPLRLSEVIRKRGMRPGIAINPTTPLECLGAFGPELDYLLLMTVEPGFSGQPFISTSPDKVQRARMLIGRNVPLAVDGHINLDTASRLWSGGATTFVLGTSLLFRKGVPYSESLRILRETLSP